MWLHLYITPNSDIDNLLIKHQIDVDKKCQCHYNKQEHNKSTKQQENKNNLHSNITPEYNINIKSPTGRRRTTITTMPQQSIRTTANQPQQKEEEISE